MNVFRCIFYTKSFQIVSGPCAFISQMMSLCRVFTYEYMYVHWLYVYIDNTMHLCIWKVNCIHSVIYIYVDMSSWMCVWWFMIRAVVCVYQNATFMWFLFIDAEPVDRKYFNMFFFSQVSSGQEAWYQWNVALQNIYLCQYNNSPRVLFWSYGLRYSNKFYAGEYICFLCNKVFFCLVPCLAYICININYYPRKLC